MLILLQTLKNHLRIEKIYSQILELNTVSFSLIKRYFINIFYLIIIYRKEKILLLIHISFKRNPLKRNLMNRKIYISYI